MPVVGPTGVYAAGGADRSRYIPGHPTGAPAMHISETGVTSRTDAGTDPGAGDAHSSLQPSAVIAGLVRNPVIAGPSTVASASAAGRLMAHYREGWRWTIDGSQWTPTATMPRWKRSLWMIRIRTVPSRTVPHIGYGGRSTHTNGQSKPACTPMTIHLRGRWSGRDERVRKSCAMSPINTNIRPGTDCAHSRDDAHARRQTAAAGHDRCSSTIRTSSAAADRWVFPVGQCLVHPGVTVRVAQTVV